MIRCASIVILLLSITVGQALEGPTMVLTPGYENLTLAKIDGKEIKEYDVFGLPGMLKLRDKISTSKRISKIQDHILDVIFQTEGNIPEIINSQGYKGTYKLFSKKVAADLFREDIVEQRFLSPNKIKTYYESNKEKYSSGLKEVEKIKEDIQKFREREISRYVFRVLDSLKIANGVKYDEKLLSKISRINISDPSKYVDSLFAIGVKNELVTYKDQKVTVKDFALVVKKLKPYQMDHLEKVSVIKSLIDGKLLNELLVEIAESKGYFEDKRVVERTNDQMKYFVSSEYKKRLFNTGNLKPTKDELLDYYGEHKGDSELKTIKKMWTYEIFKAYDNTDEEESNDKIKVASELENIRQKIITGESFETYAKFYARPNTRDGELGYIYRTDYAMIGQTADSMKVNEISELIYQNKAISIIKVTEIKESQLYKFDYVEEIIKNRVIEIKRNKLKNELRRKLFKKYKVELLYAQ